MDQVPVPVLILSMVVEGEAIEDDEGNERELEAPATLVQKGRIEVGVSAGQNYGGRKQFTRRRGDAV